MKLMLHLISRLVHGLLPRGSALVAGAALLHLPATAFSAVRLPAIISNHMVLQANAPEPIWGWAQPGEVVTVTLDTRTKIVTASADGTWRVVFSSVPSKVPKMLTVRGVSTSGVTTTRTVNDVLIGEVWLGAGQSNMAMQLQVSQNGTAETNAANFNEIRLFTVPASTAIAPQTDLAPAPQWKVCSPATAGTFSAVLYHFGREMFTRLGSNTPVGLINASLADTEIEAWTSAAVQSAPAFDPVWTQAANYTPPNKHYPGNVFNGMIAPLTNYGLRGVVWYQGEANASKSYRSLYGQQLETLIRDWRAQWRLPLPFAWVQLPNYGTLQTQPVENNSWSLIREQMLVTLPKLVDTGMAITLGLGEANNLHPLNKKDVGLRLANWASATVYGLSGYTESGPLPVSAAFFANHATITFSDTAGQLRPASGTVIIGFAIAGADKVFKWATATVSATSPNQLIISAPSVTNPVAVRYAWAFNPVGNLQNLAGLPASPFRTDNW